MLIMKRVLKLVTPFELFAISLCSKKSKMICKSTRSQLQCYKSTREFVLKCSSDNEIRLKFDYCPKTEWVFKISTPRRRNVLQKFLPMFPKNEQKSIITWVPMENESISEMSIQLFTSQEDQTATIYTFILYLSDVFNIPLLTIELHFQEFTRVKNEDIVDFYCRDRGTELAVESLRLVGKRSNTPEDDKVVDSILCCQQARYKLQLLFEPTPEFKLKPIYLQHNPFSFEAHHSHYISFEEILECKSSIIRLSHSILNSTNFKWFIENWNDGWTPPWKMIITDYSEDIDIRRNSKLQVHREEKIFNDHHGVSHNIYYCICRPDGTVGEFLVENNNIGMFWVSCEAERNSPSYPKFSWDDWYDDE
ncbi:hypothetical protein CRE_30964 [Caenorhabditis remanei]|uniref:F-box domain-containing protein n=1 Tax=Caenorhabditis remanei TaxID=31234 RepID=E3LTU4_CAERE|nr:hypothetical protein CRE_30964 [Caenorhabditis remanei]